MKARKARKKRKAHKKLRQEGKQACKTRELVMHVGTYGTKASGSRNLAYSSET